MGCGSQDWWGPSRGWSHGPGAIPWTVHGTADSNAGDSHNVQCEGMKLLLTSSSGMLSSDTSSPTAESFNWGKGGGRRITDPM